VKQKFDDRAVVEFLGAPVVLPFRHHSRTLNCPGDGKRRGGP
jgi:hypothetical protein